MALAQARAMVPDVAVEEADPEADSALLESLALFAARRWTPRAAVSPTDGLLLDLDGVAHLFGGEERMARRLVAFCARLGLTARIAVAGTVGAAHALARYSAAPLALCPPGGEAEALAPLPLAALRLDERALATARRVGLAKVGDVLAMPRAPLGRRLGRVFLDRLDQALGRLAEPVDPVVPSDAPFAFLRFAEPIVTAEAIGEALGELVRRLVATLGKAGLATRTLTLLCERVDGRIESQSIGTARPTRDAAHLTRLLAMRIERIEPGFGIEAMRLVAGRCEPLAPQPVESELAGERPASDFAPLVDRLATRLGARRLFRLGALESDVPERSVARSGRSTRSPNGRSGLGRSACCRRPSGSRMSSLCFPICRPAASPGAAAPTGSPGPTGRSGSTANGGGGGARPRRCATISRSRTRRARASGCSAEATASIPAPAI
jgi:protein ImuB